MIWRRERGGTLLLDEVDKLSHAVQSMLLTFLDDSLVTPVGGARTRRVDVRIVGTMMVSPRELVGRGTFLAEFANRVHQSLLEVPPLAARGAGDIALIAAHHLALPPTKDGLPRVLSPQALALLARHPWPDNVRGLQRTLTGALIRAGDEPVLRPAHITLEAPLDAAPKRFLTERELVQAHRVEALRTFPNQMAAADALGVHRNTLIGVSVD